MDRHDQLDQAAVIKAEQWDGRVCDKGGKDVVLVIGYDGGPDDLKLIVNDPRQYQVGADPYADAGAQKLDVNGEYEIGYKDFVQQMKWTGTINWIKPQ